MKLYGKNPVIERLKTNPESIHRIYVQEGSNEASYIFKKAHQRSVPVVSVPRSKIFKLARNVNAQGILAEVDDFLYIPYPELLEKAVEKSFSPVFLDSLNDPQNLGAIIRSLACLGGFAIVLPTHDSVEVTEAVLRVASGADNFVLIAKVSNLSRAISLAKDAGFTIAGAVVEGGQDLTATVFPFPVSLVVGAEQKGIRDIIKKQLDLQVTIPMKNPRISFNVAQAATILCYEINRQKNKKA